MTERPFNSSEILENLPCAVISFDSKQTCLYINKFTQYSGLLAPESAAGSKITDGFFSVPFDYNLLKSISRGNSAEKLFPGVTLPSGYKTNLLVKGMPLEKGGGVIIIEDMQTIPDKESDTPATEMLRFSDLLIICNVKGMVSAIFGAMRPAAEGTNDISQLPPRFSFINKFFNENKKSDYAEEAHFTEGNRDGYVLKLFRSAADIYTIILTRISSVARALTLLNAELDELKKYQLITEKATDAVFALDSEGRISFWNKSSEDLFGYRRVAIYGQSIGGIIQAWSHEEFREIQRLLKKNDFIEKTFSFISASGDKKSASFIFSMGGAIADSEIIVTCTDITEKQKFEKELQNQRERLSSIIFHSSDLIVIFDDEGKMLRSNPAFLSTLELKESELKNHSLATLTRTDKKMSDKEFFEELKTHPGESKEFVFITRSGKEIYTSGRLLKFEEPDNSSALYSGIFKDITLQTKISRDLLLMQSVFKATSEGIALTKDDKIIFANKALTKIFAYKSESDLYSLRVSDIVKPAEDFFPDDNQIEHRINVPADYIGIKKSGVRFYCEFSRDTFTIDGGEYSVYLIRDISENISAKTKLIQSEEKYRGLTENIDDFFWISERGPKGLRPVFFTSSVKKLTGYGTEEFINDSRLMFRIIHPDDFTAAVEKAKKLLANKYKRSDTLEYRIFTREGAILWIRNKLTVIRSKDIVIKIYGLVSDISPQKRAEEEVKKTAENLRKLNETKDKFLSIISHDMRTPFSSILGFTDLLLENENISAEQRRNYVLNIQDSTKTMLALVNSLLDYTRLHTGRFKFEPAKQFLKQLVQKSISATSGYALPKNISIINNIHDDELVFVDQNLILQVFNNLFSNAIKFTPYGGKITIGAEDDQNQRFLRCYVKDTGVGIKKEDIPKIFNVDNKFTTQGTAGEKGTGLGISLVKEIVEKHGGVITLESAPGEGTTFFFTLPKASATILFVDDSTTDRILYTKILKNITSSYDIESCRDVEQAIEKIIATPPALIISDHNMPRYTGLDLVKKIAESDFKVKPPVIILSSDIGRSESLAYSELGVKYIFRKPVNITVFKEAIEDMLRQLKI